MSNDNHPEDEGVHLRQPQREREEGRQRGRKTERKEVSTQQQRGKERGAHRAREDKDRMASDELIYINGKESKYARGCDVPIEFKGICNRSNYGPYCSE